MGWDKVILISEWKSKGKQKKKENTKTMIITHYHYLPTSRPIPISLWGMVTSLKQTNRNISQFLLLSIELYIALVSLGQLFLAASCPVPSLQGKQRKSWDCASTPQQQCKHCCGINTVLVTNPKHSIIPAATRQINSLPDRTSRQSYSFSFKISPCISFQHIHFVI